MNYTEISIYFSGRYLEGKDVNMVKSIESIFEWVCRINLKNYPFNKADCILEGSFTDLRKLGLSNFINMNHLNQPNDASTPAQVEFNTFNRYIGEFYINNITQNIIKFGTKFTISFSLESLFEYHIINSYAPSCMICIIAYGTLFIPIVDFNERIMVSLTTLLVLSALFIQVSDSSVRTSYFKSLDLWFLAVQIYCFIIVITHIVIRYCVYKIQIHPELTQKPLPKKMILTNLVLKIIYGIALLLFVIIYVIYSMVQ